MNNKPTISNNKIIIFIVFVSAALMSSLFIFHMRHKQILRIVANNNATIFPVARDINSFELLTTKNEKFTQKDFIGHWTLVSFGFTHCSTICPATLNTLSKAYNKLHLSYPQLQVVFVSLDPMRDSFTALSQFTYSFNPAFIGVTGNIQNVRKLQSQLGIFSENDETTAGNNYQIQHSSSILLINPNGKWVSTFKYGMSPDQFTAAFEESMKYYV